MQKPYEWINENKQRYYCIIPAHYDLFGDLTITRIHGGINSNNRREFHEYCKDYAGEKEKLQEISKKRKSRNYITM